VTRLPPVLRLGPVVQLSPEACWALWQLATHGSAAMTRRDGVTPTPFTRQLLQALAEAARHRDTGSRSPRHGDTENGPPGAQSACWVDTAEAARTLALTPRSVQRLRHDIGGFRWAGQRLEFDTAAVEAYAAMRATTRQEHDR
jgi:hypothetical protein